MRLDAYDRGDVETEVAEIVKDPPATATTFIFVKLAALAVMQLAKLVDEMRYVRVELERRP